MIVLNHVVPGLAAAKNIGIIDLMEDPGLRTDFMEKCRFRNPDVVIQTVGDPAQPRFDMVFILHHRHLYGLRRLPRLVTSLFKGARQSPDVVLYDCDIYTNRIISLKRGQVVWFTARLVVFNLVLLGLRLVKKIFSSFQSKKS